MKTFYGYTGFQRPRPLGPDTRAFALPHSPLVSLEGPAGSLMLGDLAGKEEREQEKLRREERLKLWHQAVAAVRQIIIELMAGNRAWDDIPNVQISITPERGPEKREQKRLDKLLSKDLPRAITYARTMAEIAELPSQFAIFDPTSVYADDPTTPTPILPPPDVPQDPDAPLSPDDAGPPPVSFTYQYGAGDPYGYGGPQIVTPTGGDGGYKVSPIYEGPTGVTPAHLVPAAGKEEEEGAGATLLTVGGYAAAIAAITGVGILAWGAFKKVRKGKRRRKRR